METSTHTLSPLRQRMLEDMRMCRLGSIWYATFRDKQPFGEPTVRLGKKINRVSFVMPA